MWHRRSPIHSSTGSSRRFAVLVLAGAILGAPAGAGAMTAGNLVVNGDAEASVGSEWTVPPQGGKGLARSGYGSLFVPNLLPSTLPPVFAPPPFDGGAYALHPDHDASTPGGDDPDQIEDPDNPDNPGDRDRTINEQRIVLGPGDVAAVATASVRARFSAFIGGTNNQKDWLEAVAEWRDQAGAPVGTPLVLAAVTANDRNDQSGLIFRAAAGTVPASARSAVVRLTGWRYVRPRHNGHIDDIDLRLIGIPRVEKAFTGDVVASGAPFRLTYTVRNSEDLESKPSWAFSDVLPAGIRVAPTSRATTDCPDPRIAVADRRISFGGAVLSGQDACTASVDVVADPGRYTTGAKQLEDVRGLRVGEFSSTSVVVEPGEDPGNGGTDPGSGGPAVLPPIVSPPYVPPPAPPADPPPLDPWLPSFVRPALRASLRVNGSGTRDKGDRLTLRMQVANATSSSASRVRACVTLPSVLRLVTSGERAARSRSTSRPCWTVGTLAGDDSWSTTLTVRVVRGTGSTVRPRLAATSPDAVATARATAKVRTAAGRARARRS